MKFRASAELLGLLTLAVVGTALLVVVDQRRTSDSRVTTRTIKPPSSDPPKTQGERSPSNSAVAIAVHSAPIRVPEPHQVVDAITLVNGTSTIRMAGLEGPGRDDVCFDEAGLLWACGLRARAALHNHVATTNLICEPRGAAGDVILARCHSDRDIGRFLVAEGWARPLEETNTEYAVDVQTARALKRGLWNGSWRVRR